MYRDGVGVILYYDKQVLLVEKVMLMHAKGGVRPISPEWGIPKGGRRPGEPVVDAALRELKEETGVIGATVVCSLPTYYEPFSKKRQELLGFAGQINRMVLVSCDTLPHRLCPEDEEIRTARMVPLKDAITMVNGQLGAYLMWTVEHFVRKKQ